MTGLTAFLIRQLFSRQFWYLVIAGFTMVFMLAWRSHLRNEIFQQACAKFAPRRY